MEVLYNPERKHLDIENLKPFLRSPLPFNENIRVQFLRYTIRVSKVFADLLNQCVIERLDMWVSLSLLLVVGKDCILME